MRCACCDGEEGVEGCEEVCEAAGEEGGGGSGSGVEHDGGGGMGGYFVCLWGVVVGWWRLGDDDAKGCLCRLGCLERDSWRDGYTSGEVWQNVYDAFWDGLLRRCVGGFWGV